MASGDQATGIPDYQLRRKVATGVAGIEPATKRLTVARSTAELHAKEFRFSRCEWRGFPQPPLQYSAFGGHGKGRFTVPVRTTFSCECIVSQESERQ